MQLKGPLLGRALAVASVAVIAVATLTPGSRAWTGETWCIVCGSVGGVDILLNILLFVPLGIGLALAGIRAPRALAGMCAFTVLIESLQYSVIFGRDPSLGDIIMNSLGGAAGFLIGARLSWLLIPRPAVASRLAISALGFFVLVQAGASYALVPALTASRYHGQIKRSFGGHPVFQGRVLEATIDTERIPNRVFADSRHAHAALSASNGATIAASVVPGGGWSPELAPIVRIADDEERVILMMGQEGTDLVFGLRTGAATFRLRPVLIQMHDVFPDARVGRLSSEPDTLRLAARYGVREAVMSARGDGHDRDVMIRLSPIQGWRLVFPRQTYQDGAPADIAAGMVWMCLLLMPAGYWLAFAAPVTAKRRLVWLLWPAAFVGVGLYVVPLAFRLSATSWPGLLGCAAGLGTGALCARAARSLAVSRLFQLPAKP